MTSDARTRPKCRGHSRRERKKQATRQRLLENAWRLFRERGYDSTTVEDITEAADVAKSTFFNYFATKQAILDELALWRIDALGNEVLAGSDVPDSAVARIKLIMQAMARELSPEQELTRQLFLARISAPTRHASAHRLGSIVHELVVQGQQQNEIRSEIDSGLITRLLMTCFFSSFGPHPPHASVPRAEDPVAAFESAVDALMDGLSGPAWRKP